MEFFYWNRNFEVGIPHVDRQHRRLVDLINSLASAISDGGKLPDVPSLFEQLMDYAAVHFNDEERLLEQSSLSEEEKTIHKNTHRGFVEKTHQILQGSQLERTETAEQVLEFLTTWLVTHILRLDARIAEPTVTKPAADRAFLDVSPVERALIGALAETERRFRMISDHTPALIWVADAAGERGFVNRALSEFIDLDEVAALRADWMGLVHPEDRPAYRALLAGLLAAPHPAETEYRLRKGDGSFAWILERILPRIDSNGVFMGLIASASDISAIKRAEHVLAESNRELEQEVARRTAQLEQLTLTDPLTGIGNRRFLESRLEEEVVRAQRYTRPFSVVFFDVDRFKRINDTYGHGVGDMVLTQVATCLKDGLRECDLLGRFGGEEFVVILPETPVDAALTIAERIRTALGAVALPQLAEPISISAGLTEWRAGDTADALIQRSDRALYLAKESGRNRCIADRHGS